jgi:hypothetical protein
LYLHASFGCRGVSWVLRLLAGYLPLGVPAPTTGVVPAVVRGSTN